MKGNKIICLLLAALIWGFAFVAQSVGMDFIGPFTFNGIRSIMGGLILIPVALVCIRAEGKQTVKSRVQTAGNGGRKVAVAGGLVCGVIMFAASSLQQFGIQYTQAGKAGFLTALYVVIVPFLSIFIGKKVHKKIWACVVLSVIGMYLLCISGSMSLGLGDILVILCAVGFSVHILAVDYFVERMNGVLLSCLQFLISGAISIVCMLIFEEPNLEAIMNAKMVLLYAGFLSCGAGYTFQIVGQKGVNPTVASLILSLESVFSVIGGWLLLHEVLSAREITGCIIMFAAIVIAQAPVEKLLLRKKTV